MHRPELKLMFIDVRMAHLNAFCSEEVYVELPEDFERPGECGRLKRWLYGMRPSASGWEDHYTDKLKSETFVRGVAAPTVFYNEGTGVRVVVHGDDCTFSRGKRVVEDQEQDGGVVRDQVARDHGQRAEGH